MVAPAVEGIELFNSPQPPPPEAILTALLNDLTTIQDQFVLVLDDYHVIDAKEVDHALSYLVEHLPPQMHLIIATREDPQLSLAQYTSDHADRFFREVMGLLERLLQSAEAGERTGRAIEILIVQALVHQAQGDISAALVPLESALSLAEPEGYVRIFVDEGPPMAVLLARLHEHSRKRPRAALTNVRLAYIERPLALLRGERVQEGISPAATSAPAPAQSLLDPLTERELEALCLIAVCAAMAVSRGLAVGYLASRIIEGTIMMVDIAAILLLIPLSQEFLKAGAPRARGFRRWATSCSTRNTLA